MATFLELLNAQGTKVTARQQLVKFLQAFFTNLPDDLTVSDNGEITGGGDLNINANDDINLEKLCGNNKDAEIRLKEILNKDMNGVDSVADLKNLFAGIDTLDLDAAKKYDIKNIHTQNNLNEVPENLFANTKLLAGNDVVKANQRLKAIAAIRNTGCKLDEASLANFFHTDNKEAKTLLNAVFADGDLINARIELLNSLKGKLEGGVILENIQTNIIAKLNKIDDINAFTEIAKRFDGLVKDLELGDNSTLAELAKLINRNTPEGLKNEGIYLNNLPDKIEQKDLKNLGDLKAKLTTSANQALTKENQDLTTALKNTEIDYDYTRDYLYKSVDLFDVNASGSKSEKNEINLVKNWSNNGLDGLELSTDSIKNYFKNKGYNYKQSGIAKRSAGTMIGGYGRDDLKLTVKNLQELISERKKLMIHYLPK